MIHLDSLSQNYAHQGPSIISRTRPALTPPPALRPAPPLPVYTSTEYSLPGATQLSRMRAYEIFSLFLFGNMKITFNHVKHVITFTNLAPPNRSEPSQLDWPRTVLRHFEAFITAPHLRCSVHGKRADTVAHMGHATDLCGTRHPTAHFCFTSNPMSHGRLSLTYCRRCRRSGWTRQSKSPLACAPCAVVV